MIGKLSGLALALALVAAPLWGLMCPAQASAAPQWSILSTPGSVTGKNDILSPSECNWIIVGNDSSNDSSTIWMVDTPAKAIRKSSDKGVSWSDTANSNLHSAMTSAGVPAGNQVVWDVAADPDDCNFVAVVSGNTTAPDPSEVWLSENGGDSWSSTGLSAGYGPTYIGAIDISLDYGDDQRDIAVGIRNGALGTNADMELWVAQSDNVTNWQLQTTLPAEVNGANRADVITLKFSPTYNGDSALVVVFCDSDQTFFNAAIRNLVTNDITIWVHANSVEVKSSGKPDGASPGYGTMVTADLELPSDFSGWSASLRGAYVSIDAEGDGTADTNEEGIYRLDDNVVYTPMDTTAMGKSISSIAYYGTYASGKMIAGEVFGYPYLATVPTWFTDSPTVSPIPCWYPCYKPTTGAANQGDGTTAKNGYGNAQVAWSPDGSLAYCGTSSADFASGGTDVTPDSGCWPEALTNSVALDESALAISRNNSETWNQLGLIDTAIDKLTDVAPSADSATVYLATVNQGGGFAGFDSVWRSSTSPTLLSPLSSESIGAVWERVMCHVTAYDSTSAYTQTDRAILRLAPDKTDGEIVFWAAPGAAGPGSHGVVRWSPDYGDYQANINTNLTVQDMAAESWDQLYVLDDAGLIQNIPFIGVSWSTTNPSVNSTLGSGFSVTAMAGGYVLVGAGVSSVSPVAYSTDSANSFTTIDKPLGFSNFQVAFDTDFATNGVVYAASANTTTPRSIYRMPVSGDQWTDLKPMGLCYHGLAMSRQGALYAANPLFVERTLEPGTGVPGSLGEWDVLKSGLSGFPIRLTLSPNSLKLSGDLASSDYSILWAIDNDSYLSPTTSDGRLWTYEDSFAKAGPTESPNMIVRCYVDLVPFQFNIAWGQVGGGRFYEIQHAYDAAFTQNVWTHHWYEPSSLTSPKIMVPSGGLAGSTVSTPGWVSTLSDNVSAILGVSPDMNVIGLGQTVSVSPLRPQCCNTYYYRVRVIGSTYDDIVRSPWSATWTVTTVFPSSGGGGGTPELTVKLLGNVFSSPVVGNNVLAKTVAATSPNGNLTITIPNGTCCLDKDGNLLRGLQVTTFKNPPPPPEDANIIGLAYDFEPDGAIFFPPITLIFEYDPADIPEGVAEADLVLAYYDEEAKTWVTLECEVDTANHTITASVSHFTSFAIIGEVAPQLPAAFSLSNLVVQPEEVKPGEAVTVTVSVANSGGVEGRYNLALKVNGAEQETQGVTVAAGRSESVTFTMSREEPGDYTVTINGEEGSFSVVSVPTPSPLPLPSAPEPTSPPPAVNWTLLGAILGGALVLALLMIFLVRRRRYG